MNTGTVIAAITLIVLSALAVRSIIKSKRDGKSCGGGCGSCSMSDSCQKKKDSR